VRNTYNLVLNRHNPEVDDLDRGPNDPVGFQRGHVNVLELLLHCALSTALGYSHESEEASKTWYSQRGQL
jgi:hypothetical protein